MSLEPVLLALWGLIAFVALFLLGWGFVRLSVRFWNMRDEQPKGPWWVDLVEQQTLNVRRFEAQAQENAQDYRALADLYQSIMAHVPCGFVVFNKAGQILFANEFFKVNLAAGDPVCLEDLPTALSQQLNVIAFERTGEPLGQIHLEGKDLEFQVFALPKGDWVGMIQDRTVELQRVREDQTQREMSYLGAMASGITHEVKNALAVIQGYLQLLEIDNQSPEAISMIRSEVERLSQMTSALLRTSKEASLETGSVDLGTWFAEEQAYWRQRNPDTHVVWHNLLPENLVFAMDCAQMSLVLGNIIHNACQSCEQQPGPSITVSLACSASHWWFSVEDNGPGFTESAMQKLFVPMVTTKQNGTGLGLFQARNIVRAHGGHMEVFPLPARVICRFPKTSQQGELS
ncbi:MAG: HAMP domain-containing histidine kinase [Acidobacteria bacterium]|nr:HAMP domain-containing histidine kinase [Acidobacteriota bacterium]